MSLTLIAVCRSQQDSNGGLGSGGGVSVRCLLRRRLQLFDLLESSNKGCRVSEMSCLPPIAKLTKTDKFSDQERNYERVREMKTLQAHWGTSPTAALEDAGRCCSSMGRQAGMQKFHTASRDTRIYILSSGDKLGFMTGGTWFGCLSVAK